MAFNLSLSGLNKPARYVLVHRVQRENTLAGVPVQANFSLYCETWADVKERLAFNLPEKEDERFHFVRKADQWFAAACKRICFEGRQPFYIAKHRFDDGYYGVWYVVALK